MEAVKVHRPLNLLPWAEKVLAEAKRFNVLVKGRRAGGTSLVEDLMLDLALEGNPVGWFSATDKLLTETWDRFVAALGPVTRRKQEQKRRLDLVGGGVIECWSCESKLTSRGRKYLAVAVDEAAHIQNLAEIWECEILPCLLDLHGGAWFPSSPNGLGDYHALYQRGQDPKFLEWASWQIDSYANPKLSTADISNFREIMSEARFRQEILAQFVVMEGGCFPDFSRKANASALLTEEPGLDWWVSVDPGYRTFAWILAQIRPDHDARIFESGEWHNCSTKSARDRFAAMPWASKVRVLASDPAAASTDIQTGVTDLETLRKAFPSAQLAYSYDPIDRNPEKRAEKIRDYICTASGAVRLFIDPINTVLIDRIEGSRYPKVSAGRGEKQEPVKDGKNDHLRDALGYLLVNAFPDWTGLTLDGVDVPEETEGEVESEDELEAAPWEA